MMKILFYLLLGLAAAVGLAQLSHNDAGYVLIAHGGWTAEMTLVVFLTGVVLLFGLLYFSIRLALLLWRLPGGIGIWRRRQAETQARRATRRGLKALVEGNWPVAERELARGAEAGDAPLINYLMASQAAQQQGAVERRDQYLTLAHKSGPDSALAVGLTQAQVQLEQGQLEQALATLTHLQSMAPKQGSVLLLLARLHERLGSWSELLEVARQLRRQKLDQERAETLEHRALKELLEGAAGTGNPERLREVWRDVPKGLRQAPDLLAAYTRGLITLGYGPEAEELLREALKRGWQRDLVRLYGLAEGDDGVRQLAQAESWSLEHDRDPALLLALARIAGRQQLWGKARAYLEASIGQEPDPEALRELGELLERLHETDAARECFYRALTQGRPRPLRALPSPTT